MEWIYSDGGRSKYFTATNVGDCVTRAIANATGIDYKVIYDRLKELAKKESVKHHRGHHISSVRDGVFRETWKKYLKEIGWIYHPTCSFGSNAKKMKLTTEDIPEGTLIVQISKHLTCVKNKVIHDTYDCSIKQYYDEFGDLQTNRERAVFGYWTAPTEKDLEERKIAEDMKKKEQEAIEQSKKKVETVKLKYKAQLDSLQNKIKKYTHELKLATNRMNKEIDKVKQSDANDFMNSLLS